MTTLLVAEALTVRHPKAERDALRDVHLAVRRGEVLALAGPNGAGKSTLMAALGRELAPRRGRVALEGRDARAWPRRDFARRVARLPQEPCCPEGLTVEELVRSGRYAHRGPFGGARRADVEAVDEAIGWLELDDLRRRPVERISGGERRRAWLARSLAQRADLLLLDEPAAGLDPRYEWELLERVARLRSERELTVVVVLHDLAAAARVADRVALFHRGRLYGCAAAPEALAADALRDVFGVAARWVEGASGCRRLEIEGLADPERRL